MKVLIHMLPEPGHIIPSLPLARALAARGHEVAYSSFADHGALVEAHGFRCYSAHSDAAPLGTLPFIDSIPGQDEREFTFDVIRNRVHEQYFDLTAVSDLLAQADPDIVLADIVPISPLQFTAWRLGIPCLQLSTSLPQIIDEELPPLTTALLPGAPAEEMRAARASARCTQPIPGCPQLPQLYDWMMDLYCARSGYPRDGVSYDSVFWPRLTLLPEAVLCAAALDFPRDAANRPHYIATRPELERQEQVPAALAQFVSGGGPLIYASLGSQPGRYPHGARFFQGLIGALRARPHWRAVAAVGPRFMQSAMLATLPPNLFVLPVAPQLWLLRHCDVFVTHAGLGGLREAIALNVPVVAVPQQYDQPGNAARVVHHGVGVRVAAEAADAGTLVEAISTVLADAPNMRARCAALDARCRDEAERASGVELVERIAAREVPGTRSGRVPLVRRRASHTAPRRSSGYLFVGEDSGFLTVQPGSSIALSGRVPAVCDNLALALSAGGGSLLARVSVADAVPTPDGYLQGAQAHCEWLVDVGEALYEYAAWCLEQALAPVRAASPLLASEIEAVPRRFHALRRAGAGLDTLLTAYLELQESTATRWSEGFGLAVLSIDLMPHRAAQLTRFNAMTRLFAAKDSASWRGLAEGDRLHAELRARFDGELERRVGARLVHAHTSSRHEPPAGEIARAASVA